MRTAATTASSSSTRRVGCGRSVIVTARASRAAAASAMPSTGTSTAGARPLIPSACWALVEGPARRGDVEARDEVGDGVGHGRRIVVDARDPRHLARGAQRSGDRAQHGRGRHAPVARDAALVDAGALAEREVTGEVGHPTSLDSDG